MVAIFLALLFLNQELVVAVFLKLKWKAPSQFIEPVLLNVAFDRSPSQTICAFESRSKHFPSAFTQIKKSISVGVASTEIETFPALLVNVLKPVVSLVTFVKGSLAFFNPQVSCAKEAKGKRRARTIQFFISHYCSLKIIVAPASTDFCLLNSSLAFFSARLQNCI